GSRGVAAAGRARLSLPRRRRAHPRGRPALERRVPRRGSRARRSHRPRPLARVPGGSRGALRLPRRERAAPGAAPGPLGRDRPSPAVQADRARRPRAPARGRRARHLQGHGGVPGAPAPGAGARAGRERLMRPGRIVAWALYDFANSSFAAVIFATIYATYYAMAVVGNQSGAGDLWWGRVISVSMAAVAVT